MNDPHAVTAKFSTINTKHRATSLRQLSFLLYCLVLLFIAFEYHVHDFITNTGWFIKNVPNFLPYERHIKPRPNCRGNWIEHCLHFTYLSRQWRHSRRHWQIHWSVEDFLTAWLSSTLSGQWLCLHARQCSVTPRKSDATVSTTEHFRLHSWWWLGITLSRS